MTTHPEYPLLFSPLEVGPLTLKNRIVNSPHQTGFANRGTYTDQLVAYHRERARGGAALIMSQATSVTGTFLDLYNVDEEVVPAYKRVAAAVGEFGAHYGAELYHPGAQGDYTGPGADRYVGPSSIPASYLGGRWRVAHALTEPEILAIVDAFAAAAARCRRGGISGIELHFAHGNLVEQFMSPTSNVRTDDWGGSLENRLRLARTIAEAVRSAAGPDVAVGARMTAAGLDHGELDAMDMAEIIGTVGSWELLDYVSLTMGHYSDSMNVARNMPNMSFPPGVWQRYGKQVKSVVDIPVFLVGRINHPRLAEDLLEAGVCDAVAMARALIADPYFPEKAMTGRTADIRPCVAAMNCMDGVEKGRGMRCIHNPRVGHEMEFPEEVEPGAGGKRVVVIGGGPAGLEAARVAATRGHSVRLVERHAKVGGRVLTASKTPGRGELYSIIEWLEQQCRQLGVEIRTDEEATRAVVGDADVVVVATGATYPGRPGPRAGLDAAAVEALMSDTRVVGLDAALSGDIGGDEAVVYDTLADWQGFNAARMLSERGVHVTYVTPEQYPGSGLELSNWRIEYQALTERGVRFVPVASVVGSEPGRVRVRQGYVQGNEFLLEAPTLVWLGPPLPESALMAELSGVEAALITIGDAFAPRSIEQAILDARESLADV